MAEPNVQDLFGSDSEDEGQPPAAGGSPEPPAGEQDATAGLFGSDSDEEEAPRHRVTQVLGEDDDEAPPRSRSPSPQAPRGPPLRVAAQPMDVLPQEQLRLVKLPNILGVEQRPFDPETFDAGNGVEIDARGMKRVRLADYNCIRWRWGVDAGGNQVKESNARFVRWSDGSLQLVVGDEVMDVKDIDTTGEHKYLYVRLPNLIQAQGQLARKLAFQPASLESNLHKQLRAAADKLHVKTQRVRATATIVDPKKVHVEREKAEAERIRDREKLAAAQGKTMRKFAMPAYRRQPAQLNAGYLEEDEDIDEEGLGEDLQDAQRQRMMGGRRGGWDEDEEEARAARLAAAKAGGGLPGGKRRRIEEEEEEEEEVSGEDEEGDEEMKDFIVDEEDEEGGGKQRGGSEERQPKQQQQPQQQQQPAKQRRQVVLSDSEED